MHLLHALCMLQCLYFIEHANNRNRFICFWGETSLECSTQSVFVDEVGVECSTIICVYVHT